LAERAGFEPATELSPCDGLANRCLRPLGHLSSELVGPALRSNVLDIQYLFPLDRRFDQQRRIFNTISL
jgi:hypothetical protein